MTESSRTSNRSFPIVKASGFTMVRLIFVHLAPCGISVVFLSLLWGETPSLIGLCSSGNFGVGGLRIPLRGIFSSFSLGGGTTKKRSFSRVGLAGSPNQTHRFSCWGFPGVSPLWLSGVRGSWTGETRRARQRSLGGLAVSEESSSESLPAYLLSWVKVTLLGEPSATGDIPAFVLMVAWPWTAAARDSEVAAADLVMGLVRPASGSWRLSSEPALL